MPTVKRKAFSYVTHRDRLLVFIHPDAPDAGVQVPAGTIRDGESPKEAVLREAREETGLHGLVLAGFLGEQRRDMRDFDRDEIHHRFFFHLRCGGDPAERWRHWERDPADGSPEPIPFDFFWARLPDGVPALIADHDRFLPRLAEALAAETVDQPPATETG